MNKTQPENTKREETLIECLAWWGISGCLIFLGILLCITGIGIIIGYPLIIVGLIVPFFGPLKGLGALQGECPWCRTQVTSHIALQEVTCPACKKRIVIKDKRFIKVE